VLPRSKSRTEADTQQRRRAVGAIDWAGETKPRKKKKKLRRHRQKRVKKKEMRGKPV